MCFISVVGGKLGHPSCNIPLLQQVLFLCYLNFNENPNAVTNLRSVLPSSCFEDITKFMTVVCVHLNANLLLSVYKDRTLLF